nr:tripartite motif-containing protein 15-like [Pelodiscus sinensis]|eukprot:XP_025046489.1 tripartite motif-containing protein 15-like [Pelodiscus sinensis]
MAKEMKFHHTLDFALPPSLPPSLHPQVHIQHHLETLKQKRKEVLRLRSNGEKKSQELLRKTHLERQTIVFQFRQLCQFLKEQERFQLAQLDETEQDIVKKWDQYSAKLHDEISSLSTLIYELQQKCRQPASELLQDIKSTLSRCERKTFQDPLSLSPDLKWGGWNFSEKSTIVQDLQKNCKESFSSEWKLHKGKSSATENYGHVFPNMKRKQGNLGVLIAW